MQVTGSGSLIIAKGERLSIFVGPLEYVFFNGPPPKGLKPSEVPISVPFDGRTGPIGGMSGRMHNGGVTYRHRVEFQGVGKADVTLINYTVTHE